MVGFSTNPFNENLTPLAGALYDADLYTEPSFLSINIKQLRPLILSPSSER